MLAPGRPFRFALPGPLALSLALASPAVLGADGQRDLTTISLEELAQTKVTTVSKTEEPRFQTPAAVHVVTAEDIRRSGVTSIPDALRLAPGVHVSGWVRLGRRTYVGTGAAIINGTQEQPLVIGDDAIVGAGACVTRSVEAGVTVVGVPAKPVARH